MGNWRSKTETDNNKIIRRWVGIYSLPKVPVVFSQQFKPSGLYSRPLVCGQDSKGGMSNEFSEIWREDWVTCGIKMLNCWDMSVVDHSSWRVVLVRLHTWDSNRCKSMAHLISRHFLDCQIIEQLSILYVLLSPVDLATVTGLYGVFILQQIHNLLLCYKVKKS